MDDEEEHARSPRYDGEDVSSTTDRELKGWYFAGLAAEVYAVCGVGSFGPVTLEQLAREAGVLRSDGKTSCIQPKDGSAAVRLARSLERRDGNDQCIISPFGRPVATASFAMYTFSTAVFVQALVLISFSPVADFGTYRKQLLLAFAFTGSAVTMSMIFVWPKIYLLGSLFTIIGVVCLGSIFVLLNSYLPLLAGSHPSIESHRPNGYEESAVNAFTKKAETSPELQLSTKISSKGVGLGYVAAVSVQVLAILLLVLLKKAHFASESTPLRMLLLMVGGFWLALTLPGALWLKDRPGPSLKINQPWKSRLPVACQYVKFAWKSVWQTVKIAAKLRQTWIFLIAWFLLSDSIATVSGTAILFARIELHMGTIAIALLSITVTCSGIASAFIWPKISSRYGLETKQTIIACVCLMEVIPIYGLIGFLPFIKSWGVGGLQKAWEIYPLGVVFGFVMGGLSSYCRAFYGEIIPPGSEAAFYALYAITDKGSSAVGPAIVGIIVDRSGSIRPAFGFLAILILLPLPLIYIVDVQKGRADAEALSNHGAQLDPTIRMEDYDQSDEHALGLLRDSLDEDEDGDERRDA